MSARHSRRLPPPKTAPSNVRKAASQHPGGQGERGKRSDEPGTPGRLGAAHVSPAPIALRTLPPLQTGYRRPRPHPHRFRYAYLEGAGQLCLDCYYGRIVEPARFPERHNLRGRSNGLPDLPSTSYLTGKRVLLTGAGGVIGSEICRQVALQRPEALFLVGHEEDYLLDTARRIEAMFPGLRVETVLKSVENSLRMVDVLTDIRPHVVFHAAAYKIATWMEEYPRQAIVVNVFGTLSALEASLAAGVERLVMVSTARAARPIRVLEATN